MQIRSTFALLVIVLASASAEADPSVEKNVGIGVGVGVATGPNLQLKTSWLSHLDLGIGTDFDDHMRVQLDHAWRLIDIARRSSSVAVPFYVGIGGFVTDRRYGYADAGLRVPVGAQIDFARAPLEIFGELAPEIVVARAYDPSMPPPPPDPFAVTGLMGVRAGF
jgi:hypothetical protein